MRSAIVVQLLAAFVASFIAVVIGVLPAYYRFVTSWVVKKHLFIYLFIISPVLNS